MAHPLTQLGLNNADIHLPPHPSPLPRRVRAGGNSDDIKRWGFSRSPGKVIPYQLDCFAQERQMAIKTGTLLVILVTLFILSGTAFGQIYKWVDADGNTHFSSSPPTQGKVETVQPRINTYTSRDLPASDSSKTNSTNRPNKKVVMYSAVWCGVCKQAKSYFRTNGIPFAEYDVETSSKGKADYKRLGGSGVPIILVGEQRMNGFSAATFQSMYGG